MCRKIRKPGQGLWIPIIMTSLYCAEKILFYAKYADQKN